MRQKLQKIGRLKQYVLSLKQDFIKKTPLKREYLLQKSLFDIASQQALK